jgi:single-strand DNA-binding protein
MNKVTLHGFTGKDPEIRTLEGGKKIAKFSLATQGYRKDSSGNKITDWHNLVFWEKLAELCERKGLNLLSRVK